MCCGVLRCVLECFSVTDHSSRGFCCSVLQCVEVCCSVLQCVAVCCSESGVLVQKLLSQCMAVCYSVLQCVRSAPAEAPVAVLQCAAVCCILLQCVAECCSVSGTPRQRVITPQHTATHCNALQHTNRGHPTGSIRFANVDM